MNWTVPKWLPPALVILALVAVASWLILSPRDGRDADDDGEPRSTLEGSVEEVTLYFPGTAGLLSGEIHELALNAIPVDRTRSILAAVLSGPRSDSLFAPLPAGVELGEAFATTDGTIFVDLISTEHETPPSSGSRQELLTVYSLVNSVLMNEPSLRRVVLLWNGQQRTTLAGHVDVSRPLALRRDFISEAPPR